MPRWADIDLWPGMMEALPEWQPGSGLWSKLLAGVGSAAILEIEPGPSKNPAAYRARTDLRRVAGKHVDGAGGEARPPRQLRECERRQRRRLGRLQDHLRVTHVPCWAHDSHCANGTMTKLKGRAVACWSCKCLHTCARHHQHFFSHAYMLKRFGQLRRSDDHCHRRRSTHN